MSRAKNKISIANPQGSAKIASMEAAFYDLEEQQIPTVQEFARKLNLTLSYCGTDHFSPTTWERAQNCQILSTFMSSEISKDLLSQMPALQLIATRSTGFDHIDLNYTAARNIAVANVPSYGENTVAEYAFALLLSLARRIVPTALESRRGNFSQESLRGLDLNGKTVGVIGTGRIGRNFIRMASAGFGMRVLAYDAYPNASLGDEYGVQYVELDRLLSESDAISIHCPNLPSTHHLINRTNLGLLRPGVLLVNTARGSVVEIEALIEGMRSHIFGGLALDTFEGEDVWIQRAAILDGTFIPKSEDFRPAILAAFLQQYPNVILTPHNAFNSQEAVDRILWTALENIGHFVAGESLENLVAPRPSSGQ